MLAAAFLLNSLGMILLPIVLAFYLTRKFSLPWKLVLAGAVTFVASQVLHIPVVYGLTALFNNGVLSIPENWGSLFNAIVLGLLAGIFEETARWILFKFSLKNVRTWAEGVLVGRRAWWRGGCSAGYPCHGECRQHDRYAQRRPIHSRSST